MTSHPTNLIPSRPATLIRELHGRSVRACLEQVLVPMAAARPGDIVAVRETGLYVEGAAFINGSQFLVCTKTGFVQLRLCDLPEQSRRRGAEALGRISDDWEIYGDICDAKDGRLIDEDGDTGLEMVRFLNGLGFIRSEEVRMFGTPVRFGPGSVSALMTEGLNPQRPAPPELERRALELAWHRIVTGEGCVDF